MSKTGLDALLRPEDSILVLIDHQPYRFAKPPSTCIPLGLDWPQDLRDCLDRIAQVLRRQVRVDP